MLYVTTRTSGETYTAARTLTADTAPDGGLFVPFQMPRVSVLDLQGKTQTEIIAYVLRLFFRTKLTADDVEKCLGASAVLLRSIDRKVTVAQLWNGAQREFSKIEFSLYCRLCEDVPPCKKVTRWPKLAISIAFLTALIAEIYEDRDVDIAVNAGDFLTPMAAYYCRQMGLPFGTILCAVNENSGLWDFFTHGQLNCGAAKVPTSLSLLDIVVPTELERLLFADSGVEGAVAFSQQCVDGKLLQISKDTVQRIAQGFAVSVVSAQRVPSVIHRIYTTNNYVLDSYCALTFGALQDHRATSGDIRQTLLPSSCSPMVHRAAVAGALGIPEFKLSDVL